MKIILVSMISVLLGFSASAKTEAPKQVTIREPAASWMKELSPDVARVLGILYSSCPEKLTEAMQGANAIGKVFYGEKTSGKSTQKMWQITTVRAIPAPYMSESPIATLVIDWQSKPDETGALDRGPQWDIKCQVQKAN